MKQKICLIFLLFSFKAFAAQTLSFFDLKKPSIENYFNEEVSIAGFLTCNEQQEWFLASQPNVRSCCLSKQPHIKLTGEFSPSMINKMARIEGIFQKEQGGFVLIKCRLLN